MATESSPESSRSVFASLLADPPWTSTSVIGAALLTAGGLVAWLNDMASPALARFGGCYIGGYFIGWTFRRFLKLAAMIAAAVIAVIVALKGTGALELNWSSIETQVSKNLSGVQGKAEWLKQLLAGYLPAAGAAGAGVFFGFRKR
ncbi:MAG TPA: FUN14 domain-containing protein [Nitrospiraceae bacterium]|nr:FUN14 domain-containing protein [Nitrospiraceae bacterium]